MKNTTKSTSPLFAWVEAGTELVAAQLAQVTNTINKRIDDSHVMLDELQHRGQEIDEKLRESLNPGSLIDSLSTMVRHNPLFALLPMNGNKTAQRDIRIQALSAKVDLLVEQVALLAAKEAAEKKQAANAAATKAPVRKPRATKATTKTAPKTATTPRKTTASRAKKPATSAKSAGDKAGKSVE